MLDNKEVDNTVGDGEEGAAEVGALTVEACEGAAGGEHRQLTVLIESHQRRRQGVDQSFSSTSQTSRTLSLDDGGPQVRSNNLGIEAGRRPPHLGYSQECGP